MILRIRVVRLGHNLTKFQLSQASRIPQGKLSMIENGLVGPTAEERERLAQILQVPASTLLRPACRVRPGHSSQVTVRVGG
jgi:transcriptional regulator with XRE-family HTH domain